MKPQNPRRPRRAYDTFHMGRSGMDLYSNDVGVDFVRIKSFAAYVGGSPTNMSVGCRRLGLKSALLTAFGEDPATDAPSPCPFWTRRWPLQTSGAGCEAA